MKQKMLEALAKFQKEGSGWRLHSIKGVEIRIVKFGPLEGSGYSKLPAFLEKKKAIINMQNKDNMCFKWAITRALNPVVDNPHRVTKELKEQAEKYDWDGITFPSKVKDISIREKINGANINLFGFDDETKKIYAIKLNYVMIT
jgi:hypothetical protein